MAGIFIAPSATDLVAKEMSCLRCMMNHFQKLGNAKNTKRTQKTQKRNLFSFRDFCDAFALFALPRMT
jgi:hypothetical protein